MTWQNSRIQSQLKEFLNTNNRISETEIRKNLPLSMATRKIKYLGINLNMEVKNLCSENYTNTEERN